MDSLARLLSIETGLFSFTIGCHTCKGIKSVNLLIIDNIVLACPVACLAVVL